MSWKSKRTEGERESSFITEAANEDKYASNEDANNQPQQTEKKKRIVRRVVKPERPSCTKQILIGGAMGLAVGSSFGLIIGLVTAASAPPGGRLAHIGKAMISSGGAFGFFMAIGTGLRSCEAAENTSYQRYLPAVSRTNAYFFSRQQLQSENTGLSNIFMDRKI